MTAGTTYTVTVDNHPVTYTAQDDDTVADVRAGLIGAVNADGTVGAIVAASGGASATELRLQALSSEAGSAFQVNTHTDSSQYDSAMSALANGRFITTWTSSGQDDSGTGIYGQISDAKGTPIGGEFLINELSSVVGGSGQYESSVSTLADGGFVVTWYDNSPHDHSVHPGSSYSDIYGRRFDAAGQTVGDEFMVNTYTTNYQYNPDVTGLKDGGFVVTWRDDSGQGGHSYEVRAQVFDAAGQEVGYSFGVNTYKDDYQYQAEVEALDDGGFVVAWSCLLYTSPSPRDATLSRMPSSA